MEKRDMMIKTKQLKATIKEVVRECLNEKCGGGPGHLAGGEKGKRMFKHIKQGYKGEKSVEDAERIAAATVNKNLDEIADSKQTPLDDIVRLVSKKTDDPQKAEYLVSQLFQHQYGKPADEEAIKAAIERNKHIGEAGLTSEDESSEEHDYDEAEEIKLIKAMKQIADKLDKMHKGMGGKIDETKVNMKMGPSYKVVQKTQAKVTEPDQPARTNQYDPKVTEAAYKQVSPNETDTAEENKALTIQTEPKVTENHKVQHRSYKTADDIDNDPNNVRDPEVPQA
jgi:hypothetical protein